MKNERGPVSAHAKGISARVHAINVSAVEKLERMAQVNFDSANYISSTGIRWLRALTEVDSRRALQAFIRDTASVGDELTEKVIENGKTCIDLGLELTDQYGAALRSNSQAEVEVSQPPVRVPTRKSTARKSATAAQKSSPKKSAAGKPKSTSRKSATATRKSVSKKAAKAAPKSPLKKPVKAAKRSPKKSISKRKSY